MNTIYSSEQYICISCDKKYDYSDVGNSWMCPICKNSITIKVEIGNDTYSAYRVNPFEVKIGDKIAFDRINLYVVLNNEPLGNGIFKISLKEYGSKCYNTTDWILIINGGWYN